MLKINHKGFKRSFIQTKVPKWINITVFKRIGLPDLSFEQRNTKNLIIEWKVNVLFLLVEVEVGQELELLLDLDSNFGQRQRNHVRLVNQEGLFR